MSKITGTFFDDDPERGRTEFLVGSLLTWPRGRLRQFLGFFERWRDLDGRDKAVLVKLIDPTMNDQDVADLCGLERATILKYPEYKRLRGLDARQNAPHGFVDFRKRRRGRRPAGQADEEGDEPRPR